MKLCSWSPFAAMLLASWCITLTPWTPHRLGAAEVFELRTAREMITAEQLKRHVQVLADDAFEGRRSGTRGGQAAAGYIANQLRQIGVAAAAGNGSYFQPFGQGRRNVLALIEGSDPTLSRETIVLAAHYDHVGYGRRANSYGPVGHIHNGADDNASGTSALLEICESLAAIGPRRRSILLVFFDGEEEGLLGSKHWVGSPTRPLADVKLMINVDMLGRMRDNTVKIYGTRTASGLRRLISQQNQTDRLTLDFIWDVEPNSDHASFYARDIPFLMFHTGLHEDYHRPSDDVERLNVDGLGQATRLLLNTLLAVADQETPPRFRHESRDESDEHRDYLVRVTPRQAPPRLGISWHRVDGQIEIVRVGPASAAAQAGLRDGDRIVAGTSVPIEDDRRFKQAIMAADKTIRFQIERSDAPEPLAIEVELGGEPIRLGLSWRADLGEPGTAVVCGLIPGTAAQLADLRVGDRIYQVDGHNFGTPDQLHRRLATATGRVRLLIEREGQLMAKSIELP